MFGLRGEGGVRDLGTMVKILGVQGSVAPCFMAGGVCGLSFRRQKVRIQVLICWMLQLHSISNQTQA